VSSGIKALSQSRDVTTFVTVLTGFNVLLHRWAGQDQVVLGMPVVGRSVPELEPLIGFFANTVVLHTDLGGQPTFAALLERVRQAVIGAYEHQDLPVEKLVADLGVERDLTRNPLFQAMFVYTNDLVMLPALGRVEVTPLDIHHGHVFMDLNMAMEESPDGLRGTLDYSTDLFDPATIDWLLASFELLLASAVEEPDRSIAHLPLAPRPDRTVVETAVPADPAGALPVVIAATFTADPVLEPLTFWMERLGLPVTARLAPYNQVFQELLDPASSTARNADGLRMEDWIGPDTPAWEVSDEFTRALAAFQRARAAPFVAVLCPPSPGSGAAGARWRAHLAANLDLVDRVVCLDMVPMLELYGVGTYSDPVSERAGRIPYTPEFFAALGTCLARQLAALVSEYPNVIIADGDQFSTRLEAPARRLFMTALAALARQGRRVFVCASPRSSDLAPTAGVTLLADERPLLAKLDSVTRECGVSASECVYLSSDDAACTAVRAGRVQMLVLQNPSVEEELEPFLAHTWLLDPPGAATPGPRWWRGAGR
jgi:hypothetical protein